MQGLYASVPADFLNYEMFEQLLELEKDEPGFLKEIIDTYVAQAISSLCSLQNYYNLQNSVEISNIGHLLKGASAALGLSTVASTFERIQYLGKENRFDKLKSEIQLANIQFQMAQEFLNQCLNLYKNSSPVKIV